MTGSIPDPRLEAGIERSLMSHPSWFKRLSTSRARSPEHSDHSGVRYAAQTIVEAVLRATDAADEASGVRRVTARELAEQLELARAAGKAQERLRIASFLQELLTGRIPAEPDWDRTLDMLAERLAPSSAADSPVGGVS